MSSPFPAEPDPASPSGDPTVAPIPWRTDPIAGTATPEVTIGSSVVGPPADSSSTTYRATRRPGLTSQGVAVLSTAATLVFTLIAAVVTNGLGLLFGIPFIAAHAYCAWEVRTTDRRAALTAPPLNLLLAIVVASFITDGWGGLTQLALAIGTGLVNAAPMLFVAELAVIAALVGRHMRDRS